MPVIIPVNQDNGFTSLGQSLRSLGDSMFANQALHENQRQQALKGQRENAAAYSAADAFRQNNPTEMGAQFILGDRGAADFNGYNAGRAGIAANGNPDDKVFNTALIADKGINAAPVGQGRALANQRAVANIEQGGAMAREMAKPATALDKNGNVVFAPTSDLANPDKGYHPIPTIDQQLYLEDHPPQQPVAPAQAAQAPAPADNGQPAAAPAAAPAQPQPQAPPVIQAMLDGRMPPPTGTAMRSPQVLLMLKQAAKYDPNFDMTQWEARHAQAKDIATNGNAGKMLLAYNQLLPHLKTASDLATALQNGDNRAVNALQNTWRNFTGDPRPITFDTVREVAAMDAARLLRGTGQMSEDDINHWRTMFSNAGSPAQLQSVIGTLGVDLMDARKNSIQSQYHAIMKKDLPAGLISPEAIAARDVLQSRRPEFNVQPGKGAPAQQPVKVASPEEAMKLPPGTPIIMPDGSTGTVPGGR